MVSKYDYDIGILGGGAAGLTVASGAAQLGAKTLLIEREPVLGGDCLHFGCVPSKTLIKSARVYHQIKNADRYGLPRVELPPVDFKLVAGRIRGVIAKIQKHDSKERFCGLGVKVEFGRAAFMDEHTVELDGRRISARFWVLATGSSPSTPPIKGLVDTPHLTNRELFSLDELPGSMIVLGGGPIACEMAQAFARLGSRVSLIQRSGQILSKEDEDMAGVVMESMLADGVKVYLNTKVLEAFAEDGESGLLFEDKDGTPVRVSADALLVALGRRANVDGMSLENAGVEFSPKGVKIDRRLRTTRKHIFAAGDVTGSYQFTHAAGYEGGVVLANTVFRLSRKTDYTFLPWATYTEPELASIGLNQKAADQTGLDYKIWIEEFNNNDRSLAEGGHSGRIKLLVDKSEKPVGVQIAGPHAGELIGEWVAALNGGVKPATLASAVHPYPTLGEINKRVTGDLMAAKLFSDTVRKGLKFFFHLKGRACGQEQA